MKDKLADLIPWLEKLLKSLAKVNPGEDREEVERRSQLGKSVPRLASLVDRRLIICYRSLEEIGKRSLELSGKGKVARVLDKSQDAQEVIKLVEKLRQAILVYQVSPKHLQSWTLLTRRTGVTTAVDIQPGRPLDSELIPILLPVPRLSEVRLIQGIFRYNFEIPSGKKACAWLRTPNNMFTEIIGQKQDRVCPGTVGSDWKGSRWRQGYR